MSLSVWEGLKGNFSSSLLPISPQSEETVVQFHPPASFHHPQPQLIGVPDRCHMHLWFILVWVCARMYVYIHLYGVKEMFPARVTIKTLTPRLSFRLPDCQMFSTWFHVHSELFGRCSGLAQVLPLTPNTAWHIAHKWMTSYLLMPFRPFSVTAGTLTEQPVCLQTALY